MDRIIIILACLLCGYLLKIFGKLNQEGTSALNKLIIYFFLPILSLLHIPTLELSLELIWLTASPFLVFIFGVIFLKFSFFFNLIQKESYQSLVLTSGISSTSFVGFPIFELLYGEVGLAYGVLLSLGGTILVFNTLGMTFLLAFSSEKKISALEIGKRLLSFFPFIVFICAILFNVSKVSFSATIVELLTVLASPFSVIALLAIGAQIEIGNINKYKLEIILGQLYKLVLAPFLIFIILWLLFGQQDVVAEICILGAGIGSMNAISVLSAEKGISPELSILMPAIGIPISVFTLFVIHHLLLLLH